MCDQFTKAVQHRSSPPIQVSTAHLLLIRSFKSVRAVRVQVVRTRTLLWGFGFGAFLGYSSPVQVSTIKFHAHCLRATRSGRCHVNRFSSLLQVPSFGIGFSTVLLPSWGSVSLLVSVVGSFLPACPQGLKVPWFDRQSLTYPIPPAQREAAVVARICRPPLCAPRRVNR